MKEVSTLRSRKMIDKRDIKCARIGGSRSSSTRAPLGFASLTEDLIMGADGVGGSQQEIIASVTLDP